MVSRHYTKKQLIEMDKRWLSKARNGDREALDKLRAYAADTLLNKDRWPNRPAEFDQYDIRKDEILASDEALVQLLEHVIRFEESLPDRGR